MPAGAGLAVAGEDAWIDSDERDWGVHEHLSVRYYIVCGVFMVEVALISSFLEVATSLFGLFRGAHEVDTARGEKLADLLEKISECLLTVKLSVKGGTVPHGECARLESYSRDLPELLEGVVSPARAKALGTTLLSAYNVEGLAIDLLDMPDKEKHLVEIEVAAGQFKASADLLRAGLT